MDFLGVVEDFGLPITVLGFALCYAMMYRYIIKNKIEISNLTSSCWMDFRIGFYIFEVPSMYNDGYKTRNGKLGPWTIMLILNYSLFGIFCIFTLLAHVREMVR